MSELISDIAFTPAVKAVQERKGSRQGYAAMEAKGGWVNVISNELKDFIADRNSFYLATSTADGQPYIQHRGGKRASSKSSMNERLLSPTLKETASIFRPAMSRKMIRRISS